MIPVFILAKQPYTNRMLKMDFDHIYFARHSEYIDAGEGAASSEG